MAILGRTIPVGTMKFGLAACVLTYWRLVSSLKRLKISKLILVLTLDQTLISFSTFRSR